MQLFDLITWNPNQMNDRRAQAELAGVRRFDAVYTLGATKTVRLGES